MEKTNGRQQAHVKWYDIHKGYGFLVWNGTDVFVHYSVIQTDNKRKSVEEDCLVEFEAETQPDGRWRATAVWPIA